MGTTSDTFIPTTINFTNQPILWQQTQGPTTLTQKSSTRPDPEPSPSTAHPHNVFLYARYWAVVLSSTVSRPDLEPTQPHIEWESGVLFQGVEVAGT